AAHTKPAGLWQEDIKTHGLRPVPQQRSQRSGAVGRRGHLVAVAAQRMGQRAAYRLIIVDYEDPHPASITHVPLPAFRSASVASGHALLGVHERGHQLLGADTERAGGHREGGGRPRRVRAPWGGPPPQRTADAPPLPPGPCGGAPPGPPPLRSRRGPAAPRRTWRRPAF